MSAMGQKEGYGANNNSCHESRYANMNMKRTVHQEGSCHVSGSANHTTPRKHFDRWVTDAAKADGSKTGKETVFENKN